ncbi:hypothetical protein JCM11251_000013 [Rhodosporidiobolus azoricus]
MRRRSSVALPNFGRRRDSNASNTSSLKDEIVKDIFHVGLVNLGNSCFYNTIVQALSSTQPLTDIINEAPTTSPALRTLSPTSPQYNPDLDALPSPLPMTAALLVLLDKLDPTKEDGAGTPMGKKAFNPKSLLRQLSLKHDEYAEATQQDSHELLRHLIDGVMMEEQDLIKKLSALPPSHEHLASNPRRPSLHARGATVKALNDMHSTSEGVVPEDAISESSASVHDGNSADEEDEASDGESDSGSSSSEEEEEQDGNKGTGGKDHMRPFVGTVFEGKLSSFIICDECKHVSQTKEDFMDISLSLRDDTGNRMRKRDRIRRTLQAGFFSRKSGRGSGSNKESGDEVKQAPNGVHHRSSGTSLSETEGSGASASEADETDEDHIRPAHLPAIASANGSGSRHNSLDPSKATREEVRNSLAPPEAAGTHRSHSTPVSSHGLRDPSPLGRALSVLSRGSEGAGHQHGHFHRRPKIPKPTKEQIAYIKQVLVDVPGPDAAAPTLPPGLRVARPPGSAGSSAANSPQPASSPINPSSPNADVSSTTSSLSKFRLQNAAPSVDWQNTDLFECFRQFTAVEVLEGENSFACRQCWKYLNPDLEAKRKEEKETKRAERKLRQEARRRSRATRSAINGSVTAAVAVDGDGNLLRPQDVARKELAAREAQAETNGHGNGVVEIVSDDEDNDGKDGDLTARNTPAASPRAMPTISTITPESSIPPIEPLSSITSPASPSSVPTPTANAPARRHFSMSSAATTDSAAISATSTDDYDGGISSEAFETTTDEEDNDDSPDLDERSLSGSVAESGSSKMPLTADNVAALPTAASKPLNGVVTGLAVPSTAARPSSATSNASGPRSFLSRGEGKKPPPKAQRQILRRAHKRYLISPSDLPPVLVVHLKRFMQTNKSSLFGSAFVNLKKRDDPVSFPKEMDLSPFLAPEGKPPKVKVYGGEDDDRSRSNSRGVGEGLGVKGLDKVVEEEAIELEKEVAHARYRLYALVVHFGSIDSGHYSSYVLTSRYGKGTEAGKGERKWVFCSDEEIIAVSESEVMRSKPYMLFYERVPASSDGANASGSASISSSGAFDSPKPSQSVTLQPPPTVLEEEGAAVQAPKVPSPVVEKPLAEAAA